VERDPGAVMAGRPPERLLVNKGPDPEVDETVPMSTTSFLMTEESSRSVSSREPPTVGGAEGTVFRIKKSNTNVQSALKL
jgi:hypothetical protein